MMMQVVNNAKRSRVSDEQGFILIVTMLMLVVLTVLCIGALDNSTFEVQIADNDRQSRVVFNLGDGGVYAAGRLVEETFDLTADPDYAANGLMFVNIPDPASDGYDPELPIGSASSTIANSADDFHSRVIGFIDPRGDDKYDFMLRTPNGLGDVFGRITDRFAEANKGESTEFGNRAGSATGTTGASVVIDVDIDSFGVRNSQAQLGMRYRKKL